MAGNFTGQAGNTSINGTTKKYANHTSNSNTSTTAPVWTWTWIAPAAGSGNVTFYVATNKTNNNNNDMGDMIYLSQHVFTEASSSVGLESIVFNNNVVIGVDNESNKVTIAYELNQMAKMAINVVDLNGKSVHNKTAMNGQIGSNHVEIPTSDFKSGVYIVNFFIDNKPFSKKIVVK
jgi:hypothetical protein